MPTDLVQEHILDQEIDMILFVKDCFEQSYHELEKICKDLTRHWRLNETITGLDCLWIVYPTPRGTVGIQQSLEECLLMSQIAPAVSPPGEEFSQSKGEVIRNGTNIKISFIFNL